jgi:hypothetical protein
MSMPEQNEEKILDQASNIAILASFCAGPEYAVVVAIGSVGLKALFGGFDSNHVDLVKRIGELFDAAIKNDRNAKALSIITTDYDWLKDRYDSAYLGDEAPLSDAEFKDFDRHLSDKLADDHGIVQQVNLLMETEKENPHIFFLGASLVVTFHKIQLLLRSVGKPVQDTMAYTSLNNTIDRYLKYAHTFVDLDCPHMQRMVNTNCPTVMLSDHDTLPIGTWKYTRWHSWQEPVKIWAIMAQWIKIRSGTLPPPPNQLLAPMPPVDKDGKHDSTFDHYIPPYYQDPGWDHGCGPQWVPIKLGTLVPSEIENQKAIDQDKLNAKKGAD